MIRLKGTLSFFVFKLVEMVNQRHSLVCFGGDGIQGENWPNQVRIQRGGSGGPDPLPLKIKNI